MVAHFLRWCQPWPLFRLFLSFLKKILVASRISTEIVGVEGKDADHRTTTTAAHYQHVVHIFEYILVGMHSTEVSVGALCPAVPGLNLAVGRIFYDHVHETKA